MVEDGERTKFSIVTGKQRKEISPERKGARYSAKGQISMTQKCALLRP